MRRIGLVLLLLVLTGAGFGGGFWYAHRAAAATPAKKERKILYWVDPMHPAYKSDKPGIAPDCGMNLEPVYEDGGAAAPESTGSRQPGGTFHVSPDKQQLIGVKFVTATLASDLETVRAVGKIAEDERNITRVHPRIEGWIYKVHADFTGQYVNKGDPLLTIYSPDMLATQQEYLLALRARDTLKGGPSKDAYENAELLILASRRRLELWDLSAEQIDEIEHTRKPIRTITLYSPASGYVTSRNAFPSQRVGPDTELYAITDLSRIWIMADVFEADLSKIHEGQTATVSIPNGNRSFNAKVSYLQPQVDPATRTLKVRLEAANPGLKLKPEMFVDVSFRIGSADRVTVPAAAVVNTGLRKTVFVDHGNGDLEPRAVETGPQFGDTVQVLAGLRAGERVVASGAFLIDSEAQLKNAIPMGHAHD